MKAQINWTAEWPTEPGQYLFYGCSKDWADAPRKVRLVLVWLSGSVLMFSTEGEFIYPETHHGYWAPFDVALPNWELD